MQMIFMLLSLCLIVFVEPCQSQVSSRGILGRPAATLNVDSWVMLPEDVSAPELKNMRGKVVYLYCFQSWCPGCHSSGFPTLKELIEEFDGVDDVAFLAVQTAFEGHGTNTPAAAISTAKRYALDIPIGHDGTAGKRSSVMQTYRTGGTPWTIIIGKDGVVRFNDFHVTPKRGAEIINQLRSQPIPEQVPAKVLKPVQTLPVSRGGQDVIGTQMIPLKFDGMIETSTAPKQISDKTKTQPITVYRWWTNTCPYCEASLPALEQLRQKYESKGVRFVAVYHPKPPREIAAKEAAEMARKMGFEGPVAVDQDWSLLRQAYLDHGNRGATSVTFVVDGQGRIRFLHPGPVFFASDDPQHARENEDHQLLDQAIKTLLTERSAGGAQPQRGSVQTDS